MTALANSSKSGPLEYRADITGLRALAVMPVLLFHAHLGCPGGFVGVDIFFVISGFLITSLILKELDRRSFSLYRFWERRVRRILPALTVVALASLAAGWILFLPEDFLILGKSVMSLTVFMSNVFFWWQAGYFAPDSDTYPLLHTWSLAVEEQFYLVFPLFLILLARYKRASLARSIAFLALASFALSVAGTHNRYWEQFATFYFLPTRAWELMIGALLAAVPLRPFARSWMNQTAGLMGLGLILYGVAFYTRNTRFPGLAALPPCLGAAAIIFSGGAKPTLVGRILMFRPIVFIGLISYSLYLWHYPLLVFAEYASPNGASWELRVVMLLLGFLLAGLSLRYIETPIRQRSVFPRSGQVFALAGCSMLGLLLLGGGAFLRNSAPSWVPAQAKEYAAARTNSAFLINTTLEQAATGQFAEIGSPATNQPVVMLIWGDSHAMALTPALDDLCRQYSVRGMQATHSLTPPLLGYSDRNYGMKGASVDFYTSVLRFISQKRIKAVILAADWLRYGPPDSLRTDLAGTVRDILAAGARVYIVKDVAKPGFDVPHREALRVVYGGDPAKLTIPAEQYHAANDPIEFIFDDLSRMGATVLDAPRYYLNTNGSYDVVRDGKALYWDSSHLSVEGSRVLKPMFEPIFRGDLGLDGKDALPSREAKKSGK